MAAIDHHLRLANKNNDALLFLLPSIQKHSEWIATIAFYKALHVVEAGLRSLGYRYAHGHKHRLDLVLVRPELKPIYKHYRVLYEASCIARYLYNHETEKDFDLFSQFMDANDVRQELLGIRLRGVEDGIINLLKDESTKLDRIRI
jgi:hypothetical protein